MPDTALFLSLTIIVFISAIVLAFSQEFTRAVKKALAIPAVKLLIPLALASLLIELYEEWGRWLLLLWRADFHELTQKAAQLLPFQAGALQLSRVVALFILAGLPTWIFWLRAKRKGLYSLPMFSYYIGAMLWIIAVFLLIEQP